jgi:hypothetical protein
MRDGSSSPARSSGVAAATGSPAVRVAGTAVLTGPALAACGPAGPDHAASEDEEYSC